MAWETAVVKLRLFCFNPLRLNNITQVESEQVNAKKTDGKHIANSKRHRTAATVINMFDFKKIRCLRYAEIYAFRLVCGRVAEKETVRV